MQILRFPLVVTILTLVGGACTPGPATPYTLPSGFIADTPDDIGLTVFDLKGKPMAELRTLSSRHLRGLFIRARSHCEVKREKTGSTRRSGCPDWRV